jgi:hypothetical protein
MPIQSDSRVQLTRRIATGVCALCLVIPAAAGASSATNPAMAEGPYGIVPAGPQSVVKAEGAYGIVPAGPRSAVKAEGPYGIVPAGPRSAVKAKGPYGITPPTAPQDSTGASVHAVSASPGDGTNGWRTAAFSEAALLAGLALAFALLLPGRRRGPRMVT